ncbi:hypothetical protein [Nitratireductor aquibiodomus]|uniref:hypothetical protein n=1 Tax=Nitratireductor aquibiodomus TaxID=204799 RepID=UPI0012DFBE45|nr:hypothetical protein [Nitratireductor aquibiodomus]
MQSSGKSGRIPAGVPPGRCRNDTVKLLACSSDTDGFCSNRQHRERKTELNYPGRYGYRRRFKQAFGVAYEQVSRKPTQVIWRTIQRFRVRFGAVAGQHTYLAMAAHKPLDAIALCGRLQTDASVAHLSSRSGDRTGPQHQMQFAKWWPKWLSRCLPRCLPGSLGERDFQFPEPVPSGRD